jgi:hypothetical protein
MAQIADYVQLNDFTPGRAAFAAKQIRERSRADGEVELENEASVVVAAAQSALARRREWAKSRAASASARAEGNAVELDNQVGRLVAAIYANTRSFAHALGEREPETDQARELLRELFPRGAYDVTHRAFEEETAAISVLTKKLEGRFSVHAAALGLTPFVHKLARVNAAFGDALRKPRGVIPYDAVTVADRATQEMLAALFVTIMARYRSDDDTSVRRRAELLAPIIEQDERIADAIRRRRPLPDVDPETGKDVATLDC